MKTFTTGWTNSTANGTVATFDLGQTYTVTGVYVLSTTNTPAYENKGKISLAEVELYVKKDVQLDAPKNLQATEIGENSITVAANTLNPAAAGTLKYQLKLGDSVVTAWTTDATFTNLTAGTTYTVEAMSAVLLRQAQPFSCIRIARSSARLLLPTAATSSPM